MKNATPLLVLALIAALCGSAIAAKYDKQGKICCLTKGETYSAPITGKVCQDCVKAIADALFRIKGVDDAWARWPNPYEKGILKVRAKDTVEVKAIEDALKSVSSKMRLETNYQVGEFRIVSAPAPSLGGAASSIGASASDVSPDSRLVKLNIRGMDCPVCVFGIEKALKKVPGVQNASVDFGRSAATISLDAKAATQPKELIKAVESAGYKAEVVQ